MTLGERLRCANGEARRSSRILIALWGSTCPTMLTPLSAVPQKRLAYPTASSSYSPCAHTSDVEDHDLARLAPREACNGSYFDTTLEYDNGNTVQVWPYLSLPAACGSANNGYEAIKIESPNHGSDFQWRTSIDCNHGSSYGTALNLVTTHNVGYSLAEDSRFATATGGYGDHYGLLSYQSGVGWVPWKGIYCYYDHDSSYYISAPSQNEVQFVAGANPPGYLCLYP